MAHFYFIRHGQTTWNAENKICGMTDAPLTDLGHQQAIEAGRKLAALGVQVDEILYSPLQRVADTALHVSEITGVPARPERRLIEQSYGIWEGTPRNGEEFAKKKEICSYGFEGGETMLKLAQRVYNLLDEIVAQPEKTYVLVAHGGIARMVHSYFHEMSNEEFARFRVPNAEVIEYKF